MRIAIFDFDGTLYKKETFRLMMKSMKEHPTYRKKYRSFFLSILPTYISYKLKLYPEEKMKESLMGRYIASFDQVSDKELRSYFSEIAAELKSDFNEQVVNRLEEHTNDGLLTILVSGAFTPLLQASVTEHPFDLLIGTDIPMRDERVLGDQPIYHIQGERKTDSLLKAIEGQEIDWENSYAYGDSFSDVPVLELVGQPVAVQPDPELLTMAQEKNWEIIA